MQKQKSAKMIVTGTVAALETFNDKLFHNTTHQ